MKLIDLIKKRQSDRTYIDKPVEEDKIKRCLEAARLAPSASNSQPWTDAYTALQALTTGPAWQFFEEERVGKLKPGMEASFVILDRNPLKVAGTDEIKDIVVLETIKEGTTIYKATTAGPDTNRTIGSDRDAYGCLPAAGYSWCARIEKCVRPWQLASKQGFENTLGAFDKYCGNSGN